MNRVLRTVLKTLAEIVAHVAILAAQIAALVFIYFNYYMSENKVPNDPRDCLIYGIGLIASLAVLLHYPLRRKLAGVASFLSVLEAFLLAAPAVCFVLFNEGVPSPFFASGLPGLMIYQGVVMLLMLIVPTVYALFYLYVAVEKGVSAARRSRGPAKGEDKRRRSKSRR